MRNATTYAVNSVVNNVRTGTRLMRIAMSSEAKHASPNNMEMNDFAVALACIPYDCQPYTDVSTSSRGKRKNGRKRRAVSRKYRQLMIVYRVNNQGGDWRPIGEWNADFCAIKWQHGHCGKHQHV